MPIEDDDEVSKLEHEVENVLNELSNLEVQFEDVLKPRMRTNAHGAVDTNYLVAVRRFQNGMRVSLLNGAETGNKQTFLEGFKFYVGALTMLKANSDVGEIQQLNNELIQNLVKIIGKGQPEAEEFAPNGPFFLKKSCQHLATIYELSNEFGLAMKFHDRAANFSTGIDREVELLQKILDALLSNQLAIVQNTLGALEIKHIQKMAMSFYEGFTQNDLQKIGSAKGMLESLAAQRGLSIEQTINVIDKLIKEVQEKVAPGAVEHVVQVPAPSQSVRLSDDIIGELRTVLKEGIQQLKTTQPGGMAEAPVIDAGAIITELKSMISDEIKTISSEIVSQIVSKLPVGLPSGPRAHSGGTISDAVPDIKVVAGAIGERAARPKLDDMLDSIIVSE